MKRVELALFAAALLAASLAVASLAIAPIGAGDTDLWYHLAHGESWLETGELPASSDFSFLEPKRPFTDYYWLFQVTVARLFESTGYAGLMVFRATLFGVFAGALAWLLLHGTKAPIPAVLVYCVSLVLHIGRFESVRPHAISYVAIALFLLVLERAGGGHLSRHGARTPLWPLALLPPLAVVWVNCHGIEYPVLWALCGAYFADLPWRHGFDPRRWPRPALALGASTTLAALAVLATPHGLALLPVPFRLNEFASEYIQELRPAPWWQWLPSVDGSFGVSTGGSTLVLVVAALGALAARAMDDPGATPSESRGELASQARPGALQPHHWILLAVGLYLGSRAVRFRHELALLALPLLLDAPWPRLALESPRRRRVLLMAALVVPLATVTFFGLRLRAESDRARAVAQTAEHEAGRDLANGTEASLILETVPRGTTTFLLEHAPPGRVLNHPNEGGWLFFHLWPTFPIAMDMEIPFLFTDDDIFQVSRSFLDPASMGALLTRYNPPYVLVPRSDIPAEGPTAFPHLVRVFFDDQLELLVDRRQRPDFAARWRLEHADPNALSPEAIRTLPLSERDALREELERMVEVDPRIASVQEALATLSLLADQPGAAREAVRTARAVRGLPPGDVTDLDLASLDAEALRQLGRCDDALATYRAIIDSTDDASVRREAIVGESRCLSDSGQAEAAYRSYARLVADPAASVATGLETAPDLLRLAMLAAVTDDPARALPLLARARAATTDPALLQQIETVARRVAAAPREPETP